MTILDAIQTRHTVRSYNGAPLDEAILQELRKRIELINEEGHLHFQLVNGQKNAFDAFTIRYGKWTGVTNYIALIGEEADDLEERCGYYGEQLVLWAQTVGLKTGWVETGYDVKPDVLELGENERLVLSIAIGESEQTGRDHKVKSIEELSEVGGETPDWFRNGMECAVLAPTAGNQQLFTIHYNGTNLSLTTEPGFLEQVDVGVVKYHFELGSGVEHSAWK